MRKILKFAFCFILFFAFSACTSNENKTSPAKSESGTANTESKVLVVYYSATGNTKDVAEEIAKITSGQLFEVQPEEPFTQDDLDWTNSDSRVSKLHDNPDERDIQLKANTPENWHEYTVIYLGYPIWWREAAWPVDTFVKNNDFTGKTVIPFCTSSSSGLGNSAKNLEDMTKTGDWKEGERFSSSVNVEEIKTWLKSMD